MSTLCPSTTDKEEVLEKNDKECILNDDPIVGLSNWAQAHLGPITGTPSDIVCRTLAGMSPKCLQNGKLVLRINNGELGTFDKLLPCPLSQLVN